MKDRQHFWNLFVNWLKIDTEKKVGADSNLSILYDVVIKDGLSFLRL